MALLPPRVRRRVSAAVTALLLPSAVLTTSTSFAQGSDAKASLADADKAVKSKDWATAARSFDAANKADPSSAALEGLANAYYQGGQLGEAFTAYAEWLEKYGAKAPAAKKKTAEARIKELGAKTSEVTILVNEPGAQIAVDDKPVGASPLLGPLRVAAGPRRIRVTKDGFLPFEQAPNLGGNTATSVQVTLTPASTKGKLVVREKTGKSIRVTVDGVDMGDAPWTGEVEAGQHEIGARAAGLVATPQRVDVERGKTHDVELVASANSASVKIGTSDAKGLIYIDDKLVGEGSFIGDVPAGTHKLKITREGYDPFEEELVVKEREPLARTVTLKLSSTISTGPVQEVERLEGVYGGFGFIGLLTPGGTGNSIENQCESKGDYDALVSCDAPGGLGGGLGGFVGYHWDPVGIELYLAGHYDQRTMNNDWNAANTDPGLGPDPARLEEFNLRRLGGMAVARVRLTWQSSKIRLGVAGGAGVSYRTMYLERLTTAKDSPLRDAYVSDGQGYVSPVVTIEPSVMYRLKPGVAVSLGLQVFFETPSSFLNGRETPRTQQEPGHSLGLRGLTTPSYELASNVQVFVGPVLGMMFGP
ncbi:MAG: PEGA domain-containing protein [Labilithrix sp.]|nr:PEGA domain-containing protein [Labilithrix sp.]MCW5831103.1 PEGA domain-containing protein [Labilithrix sp.]